MSSCGDDSSVDARHAENVIEVRRNQRERILHEWLQMASRVIVLANAGGAVATLSFIGTTMNHRSVGWVEITALLLFIAGLIFPATVMIAQAHRLWSDLHTERFLPSFISPEMDRISTSSGRRSVEATTSRDDFPAAFSAATEPLSGSSSIQ